MKQSTEAAWKREMRVILRAMARRITWWQAAEITGINCRQLRRSCRRYEEDGYDGLRDRPPMTGVVLLVHFAPRQAKTVNAIVRLPLIEFFARIFNSRPPAT